jgi:hypothetical protein
VIQCLSQRVTILMGSTIGSKERSQGQFYPKKQWFSTFLSLRHSYFENKFGGTPKCKKETKMMKILLVLHTFLTFYDFAAHLEKFDGTLVRRGTPVEKHCYKR